MHINDDNDTAALYFEYLVADLADFMHDETPSITVLCRQCHGDNLLLITNGEQYRQGLYRILKKERCGRHQSILRPTALVTQANRYRRRFNRRSQMTHTKARLQVPKRQPVKHHCQAQGNVCPVVRSVTIDNKGSQRACCRAAGHSSWLKQAMTETKPAVDAQCISNSCAPHSNSYCSESSFFIKNDHCYHLTVSAMGRHPIH